jgi:Bacterial regulatory protein, Fis family
MEAQISYLQEQRNQDAGSGSYRRSQLTALIEREVEAEIGPPLRDISQGFATGLTDMLYSDGESQAHHSRSHALQYFDKSFMKRELKRVYGNIAQYTRDALGAQDDRDVNNLRRNVYRQIERHGLWSYVDEVRPWKPNDLDDRLDENRYMIPPQKVETALASALSGYKEIIRPKVYDDLSARIRDKAPALAEKIADYAPTPLNRLKEIFSASDGIRRYDDARSVFERQVIYDALSAAGFDKKKAAGYLGDSLRTLNRRIKELGMGEQASAKKQESESNVIRIEEFVQRKPEPEKPAHAVGEIERFQQLVREYNARRESERVRKEVKKKQVKWKMAA